MRTIVFATHKGGCGKSILAACLAVAAKETGERVFLLDLDPKGSLLRWSARRSARDLRVRAVPLARLRSALTALARRKTTLVLIDTPALESPISLAAIELADLSIIPARPAPFDIWTSEVTGRRLNLMDRQFVFLLNQCPPAGQAERVRRAAAALSPIGIVLRPQVRTRAAFLAAQDTGQGVTEVEPRGDAAAEIRSVWRAIRCRFRAPGAHR